MKKLLSLLLISFVILTFNSCTVGNFLKRGFEDFTTYFNIYYNASRIFDEAEEELLTQQKDIFTTKTTTPTGNYSSKFVQVIEKCSKILQYHQNSSLVDDALFMIGRSYYYQREYPSAIRKFTELISNFPASGYVLESKFWIARSYAQTVEVDRAFRLLNEVYLEAKNLKNRKVMSDALLEILKIHYKRNDNEGIINIGTQFVEISKDKNAIAQVYLLMGTTYARLGQLDKATSSYSQVRKYTNDYYYRFKSQLELAKIFREQKKFNEAKNILENLYDESLYDDYKDYIELEFAYFYLAQQDTINALNYFVKIDTTYSTRETGAIAQFEIANYLENVLGNLDSARYYYDKSLRAQLPDDIKKTAQFKSQLLSRYKSIWTSINNFEKQIPILRTFTFDSTYQRIPEMEIDSSMLSDSVYLMEVQAYQEEKRKSDSLYIEKLKQDSLKYQANLKTADSLEVVIARLKFDLATLFLIDYNKPDSAYYHLKEIVTKFPDRDFSERSFYALANYYEMKGEKEKADSLFKIIYDNFTDTEISKIVAKKLGLKPRTTQKDQPDLDYREAEELVNQNKFKEAIQKLYAIHDKYQSSDYAPKSLLMIGNIYENKLQLYDSAYSVYKVLKEKYPASLFTQRINSKLIAYESEMQRRDQQRKALEDSLNQQKQIEEPKEKQKDETELKQEEEKSVLEIEKEKLPETQKDSLLRNDKKNNPKKRK
ncbi:MAG: tetratricopeptide repeat protein [Ignavibacteria bacterium]|nr:tetratricopeptide repeat protein [Ignavibacteria bacterium]